MKEPDKLLRIVLKGEIPEWIDSLFDDIPERQLSGDFYEAIGFDEPGKSFRVGDKDIQVQFYNAERNDWATFSHIVIFFFYLNNRKGYTQLSDVFDLTKDQPQSKDFTQTVIGLITAPIVITPSERNSLADNRNIDYHEVLIEDFQWIRTIIQRIIKRSHFLRHLLKIACVGSEKKTKIIRRYAEGKFTINYLPTLGVDITTKQATLQISLIEKRFLIFKEI